MRWWKTHAIIMIESPDLLVAYNKAKRISENIEMDQCICKNDHNRVGNFCEERETWYLREDHNLNGVHCICCGKLITTKKDRKAKDGVVMDYRSPIYVCSKRQEGYTEVICSDCWAKELTGLNKRKRKTRSDK